MKYETGTVQVTTAPSQYGTLGDCGISTAKFTCKSCGQEVNPMAAHYCQKELWDRIKAMEKRIEKLELKLKDKENARARMQSQRDHMSAKLAELTGMTPKEVRDGVKLLALGIKDKLAVEDMR